VEHCVYDIGSTSHVHLYEYRKHHKFVHHFSTADMFIFQSF